MKHEEHENPKGKSKISSSRIQKSSKKSHKVSAHQETPETWKPFLDSLELFSEDFMSERVEPHLQERETCP
jgi:hypothetical protein